MKGLTQFKQHEVLLKASCSSNMTVALKQSFEQSTAAILAIGALDTGATNPAASTAGMGGIIAANVGGAAIFVLTAVEVGTWKQRSGDVVVKLVRGAVDEGAAPSDSGSGGGGGGGAAAKPESGKRKRDATGSGKGRASKKSNTGASSSTTAPDNVERAAVDHGDGTYGCSYRPSQKEERPTSCGSWKCC